MADNGTDRSQAKIVDFFQPRDRRGGGSSVGSSNNRGAQNGGNAGENARISAAGAAAIARQDAAVMTAHGFERHSGRRSENAARGEGTGGNGYSSNGAKNAVATPAAADWEEKLDEFATETSQRKWRDRLERRGEDEGARRPMRSLAREESHEMLELMESERTRERPGIRAGAAAAAADDDDDIDPDLFVELTPSQLAEIERVERELTASSAPGFKPVFQTARDTFVADPSADANDAWDDVHVKLPCSRKNCFKDDNQRLKQKWDLVRHSLLSSRLSTTMQLQDAIFSYNDYYAKQWRFDALHQFFSEVASDAECTLFLEDVIPRMVQLCLKLPELVKHPIPLLTAGHAHSVTLSQQQIASLLANAFFCTFPRRNSPKHGSEFFNYPSINFNQLFAGRGECSPKMAAKFRCLFNYFHRITSPNASNGNVTFSRVVMSKAPRWTACDQTLCRLTVRHTGTIEDDGQGMLQMDFANRIVGGGVLGSGAVQEEIRFVINPELIVSRLFTEQLLDNEALVITGTERFSSYTGYASTFTWSGNYVDTTPLDDVDRRLTSVVAVDALQFRRRSDQYHPVALMRELNKAAAAFYSHEQDFPSAVAGGMWGCGVFNGDPELKALVQLMACTVNRRDFIFFTFGDVALKAHLEALYQRLIEHNVTVAKLHGVLVTYCENLRSLRSSDVNAAASVFQFCSDALSLGLDFDNAATDEPQPLSPTQPSEAPEPVATLEQTPAAVASRIQRDYSRLFPPASPVPSPDVPTPSTTPSTAASTPAAEPSGGFLRY